MKNQKQVTLLPAVRHDFPHHYLIHLRPHCQEKQYPFLFSLPMRLLFVFFPVLSSLWSLFFFLLRLPSFFAAYLSTLVLYCYNVVCNSLCNSPSFFIISSGNEGVL